MEVVWINVEFVNNFVVGEGLYEGYGGKWQETLFESEREGEEDMVHTRPYKYTDEDVDVFELLLSIKFELPVLYTELLECFGFGYGRRAKIKEKVKIALTKYSQLLFIFREFMHACKVLYIFPTFPYNTMERYNPISKETESFHTKGKLSLLKFDALISESEIRQIEITKEDSVGKTDKWMKDYVSILERNSIHTVLFTTRAIKVPDVIFVVETVIFKNTKTKLSTLKDVYPNVKSLYTYSDDIDVICEHFPNLEELYLVCGRFGLNKVLKAFPKLRSLSLNVCEVEGFEDIANSGLKKLEINILDMKNAFIDPITEENKVTKIFEMMDSMTSFTHFHVKNVRPLPNIISLIIVSLINVKHVGFVISSHEERNDEVFRIWSDTNDNIDIIKRLSNNITTEETEPGCWLGKLFSEEIERNRIRNSNLENKCN